MKATCFFATVGSASLVGARCPPEHFDSIASFDLYNYAARKWYVQQQAPTGYNPASQNYCAYAEYTLRDKPTSLGYDVDVHNYAEEKDGTVHDTGSLLKAKIVDERRGKLLVAAFSVPPKLAGPYWVIDYSEHEGYALVSGGPPKVEGYYGKCKNGGGTNGAGLWILTRRQARDSFLVKKVRSIAESKGFDLSVLHDVYQENCRHVYAQAGPAGTYLPPPRPPSYHEDKVLVTLGLIRYPGMASAKDLGGHVVVTTDHYGHQLSYSLNGVDPYCVSDHYKVDRYPSKYLCGINIREGNDCGKPQETLWDHSGLHADPWLRVRYHAIDYDTHGKVVVKTHVQAQDLSGKVLVVHDSKGERLACSKLVPVSLLYAQDLNPYPSSDTRYCVSGQVDVKSVKGYQVLSYQLHGIDPSCSTKDHLPKNGCGIHIHEGEGCEHAAGHWHAHDNDPWLSVRYYAEGDKATAWHVKVQTGLHMKDILYRTVVIHDRSGKRISCSKLYPVKHLVAQVTEPYLVTRSHYIVTGDVTLAAYDGYHILHYNLYGIDPKCSASDGVPRHGCGVRIHEGSCDAPGATFWDKDEVHKDPYKAVRYYSDKDGSTYGQVTLYGGYDLSDLVHKVVLIYDYNGKAIACKALLPPPGKGPVCGMKPRTGAQVIFVHNKEKECLPSDAVVQLLGEARSRLDTVAGGDKVLTRATTSELVYEPIMGFLHAIPTRSTSSLIVVTHEHGQFRATANHMVFVVSAREQLQQRALRDVTVNESFLYTLGGVSLPSRVISVSKAMADTGLLSPLTPSGTIIVDDVVVSVYARSGGRPVGHSSTHSAFYLLRVAYVMFGRPFQFLRWIGSAHIASSLASLAFGGQSCLIK
eukprot:TRINITY_DN4680_c0_g3_i1.p1 TRINITY_DN4680_c0_g3~~TRINITY_DN4680_c0_g3_i1.p1  ORF type:complete len:884 (-),score=81.41 TRINITY_DN4680_c0_g3_i1:328-2916(-)